VPEPERPAGLLEVGRIGRAHGVHGELYVDLTTDRDDRLAPGARLWARGGWLTVAASRAQPQPGRFLATFDGVADRTAAERLTNATVHAEPVDDPDALWVHELIGSSVVELDGTARGRCVAVVDNPAADLLELESGALVPVVFIVSAAAGVVTIDPPVGLFDTD
jgi:16S rRNA processing protein RimM